MATELVTFKMEDTFLEDVDRTSKEAGFHNRTEFIREALRDKIEEIKMKKAMLEIGNLKGRARKTTDQERESVREKVFKEFEKKFR
jgi:metal-responsive CopG/Arc/MetJ family transcriptional regulator